MHDVVDDFDEDDEKLQHDALNQLDEWRQEARDAVEKQQALRPAKLGDDISDLIEDELLRAHRAELEQMLDKLKKEKAELDARMESDQANGVTPTQEDMDEQEALQDAIDEIEDLLNA